MPTASGSRSPLQAATPAAWPGGRTYELAGLRVTVSAPVVVERRTEHFWYPNLVRFADGALGMVIRLGDDVLMADDSVFTWSHDGGLSWSECEPLTGQSYGYLTLPSGETGLIPFHFYTDRTAPDAITAPMTVVRSDGSIRRARMTVTGLPRPDGFSDPFNGRADAEGALALGRACFFSDGQTVRDRDGAYLTTIYAMFAGAKRYSLMVIASVDGLAWTVRAMVADDSCRVAGCEGPDEADLCRMPDGRLMCVFRSGDVPFRQSWSADEGRTWSEPAPMTPGAVEPRLLRLDHDVIALVGGRPGLFWWFDRAGDGREWQAVDATAHHNACLPGEPLSTVYPEASQSAGGTSAYTGLVQVAPDTFLYAYDRVPRGFRVRSGWKADPKDAGDPRETFGIYVARVRVERTAG